MTGEVLNVIGHVAIFPASHYVVSKENMERAIGEIEEELEQQIRYLKGKISFWKHSVFLRERILI